MPMPMPTVALFTIGLPKAAGLKSPGEPNCASPPPPPLPPPVLALAKGDRIEDEFVFVEEGVAEPAPPLPPPPLPWCCCW